MSIISKPYTFSPNTAISSSQVNANFDTIINDYNGNIGSSNISDGAITTAKLANDSVSTAKLQDESVTTPKVADGAVTPEKRSGGFYQAVYVLASSGSGTITDVPFAPRAIMVHSMVSENSSSSSAWVMSTGFASTDGSTITQSATGGAATEAPVVGGRSTNNRPFLRVSGSGSNTYAAEVTAFNSDGISYSVAVGDSSSENRKFSILFMG